MEKNNQFFTIYEDTEAWLNTMGIENYTINDDLMVDVNGSVFINNKKLEHIPVQFGVVSGNFNCNNNNLQNLKGSPKVVDGNFWCGSNQLTTLKECPHTVDGDFWCHNNPFNDMSNIFNTEIRGNLYFTSIKGMEYLDNYKDSDGDIRINFNELKRIQSLKLLNDILNKDLPTNTNITKKMKI